MLFVQSLDVKVIIVLLLFVSFNALADREYVVSIIDDNTAFRCTASSIISKSDKKYYHPPESAKNTTMTFVNDMDEVIFETANSSSIYTYTYFVDLQNDWFHLKKGELGINYKLINSEVENYLDIFENGKFVMDIKSKNDPSLSYVVIGYCPDLRLAIKRTK